MGFGLTQTLSFLTSHPASCIAIAKRWGRSKSLFRPSPGVIAWLILGPDAESPSALLGLEALVRSLAAPVGVPDVDPQASGISQDIPAQIKDFYSLLDVVPSDDLPARSGPQRHSPAARRMVT